MTDMEIAIGFGREPGNDLFVFTGPEVLFDDLFQEIKAAFF
jgi:hypothetical protein